MEKRELEINFVLQFTKARIGIIAEVGCKNEQVKRELERESFISQAKELVPSLQTIVSTKEKVQFVFTTRRVETIGLEMLNEQANVLDGIVAACFNIANLNILAMKLNSDLAPLEEENGYEELRRR